MRSVPLLMGNRPDLGRLGDGRGVRRRSSLHCREQVFHKGAAGIGAIWGFAGIGLLIGGPSDTSPESARVIRYKRTITVSYLAHGLHLYAVQPGCVFRGGFGLDDVFTSGNGGHQRVEQLATPDPHTRRVSRAPFSRLWIAPWSVMILSVAAAGIARNTQDRGPSDW
jgi:hypothetical protein